MSGGTRSYEMAKRMVESGHEVHLITSNRDSKNNDKTIHKTIEAGIHVYWIPNKYTSKMSYSKRILSFIKFAFKSIYLALKVRPEMVFATSTPLTIAIPGLISSKIFRSPMIFEVRDLWPEMPIAIGALRNPYLIKIAKLLEKIAYFNSESIVALSPGIKSGIVSKGYPSENIAIIPNASDIKEFSSPSDSYSIKYRHSRPWLLDRPWIIYTGSIGFINGLNQLIDIAYILKSIDPEIRISIIGEGSELENLIYYSKIKGVYNNNLFFESSLSKREMPNIYNAATIASGFFINLPEMQSNSSNKFFDALASGKPFLLNYGGWMHDLLMKHKCAISAWNRPLNDVASEIATSIRDSSWLEQASKSSFGLANKYFHREKLSLELSKLLVSSYKREGFRASKIAPGIYE